LRRGESQVEPLSEMADELEGDESDETEPAG
jgi:hypothetical protein